MADYHYHYKREERLGMVGHRPMKERGGSLFRSNRSLVILLLDITILLIVFGIWWFFLRTPTDETSVDGYRIELSARLQDGETVATLTIRNSGSDRGSELFDAELSASGVDAETRQDVLPLPGDLRVLRISWDERLEDVRATISWSDRSVDIRTVVRD